MRPLVLAVALASGGCLNFGKVDDAKIPGELLGTYSVEGTLVESDCGEGAFGSPSRWDFDVKLSRFHEDLYWLNGREVIAGSIASDGVSFSFSTHVEGEVTPAERGREACVLKRMDTARGRLSSDSLDVQSFEAALTFAYSALKGSDCGLLAGLPEAPASLPCSLRYDLSGVRRSEE